jgi:hypothetical protein
MIAARQTSHVFRDLRIIKKKKKLQVYVGDSETVTKHCLIANNV